jgi:catechol 2,3-dioxygenase-like lactoylglutathione lyase family enzyme
MNKQISKKLAPNLTFSHMGLSVKNIDRMEKFYTEQLGFTVTDRGQAEGMDLVFMSRDPHDHHQIVLGSGRPENLPENTANPQFGPSINQISFKMGSLEDLRNIRDRLAGEEGSSLLPANHGIAWSIYAHDPEGNNLEFFVDTEWYIPQPCLLPLDLTKSDEEIIAETRAMCMGNKNYEHLTDWRKRISERMSPFVEPTSAPGKWVRSGFWTGVAKPGFRRRLEEEVLPVLKLLPGVSGARILWPDQLEDNPPDIACQVLVEFDQREDVDRMMASPERDAFRALVADVANELFEGRISHINYQVGGN